MKLVNLAQYRSREVVAVLEELLEDAKAGDIQGIAFIVKVGPRDNRAGVAGTYKTHPEQALQATFALERLLARSGPFSGSQ